jgi:hypothetical protein
MIPIEERSRLVEASWAMGDPVLKERSAKLAEMNRQLHALPLRSPERFRFAMTMADFILGGSK